MQAEGGGSRVVLDDDGSAQLRFQGSAEVEVGPAEVHGEGHVPGHGIHAAGDADTDRVEVVALQAGGREGFVECRGDGGGGTGLVADGGGVGGAAPDVAVGVDDEDRDLRAADVDAGDVPVIDAPSGRARG